MNNPNMYGNKRKSNSFVKYIIIWLLVLGVIAFFLIKSLGSSTSKSYSWNINEYEYALTLEDNSEVNEQNFSTTYDFSRDRIEGIELDLGYIKSTVTIVYRTSEDKKASAYLEWSSNDGGEILSRIQDANAACDTYFKENNKGTLKVELTDATNQFTFMDFLIYVMPTAITIIIAVILFRSIMKAQGGNNQSFDFGKSKARLEDASKTRFTDVAGCDDEKEEMKEIVDYLKNPKKYSKAGARIP